MRRIYSRLVRLPPGYLFPTALTFAVVLLASYPPSSAAEDGTERQAHGSYGEEDEALYRKRFEAMTDRTGRSGLAAYDPLKNVAGAVNAMPLEMAMTPGISSSTLEAATAYALAMNSTALLIWRHGELEAEMYFGDVGAETPLVSMSLAKPLSVIAVGRAMQEGHIAALDEPVANYFHEWRGTPRAAITIRQLLGMRSDLKPQAPAPNISDILNRAYLHPRHDEVIISDYPLTDEPGIRYEYSNANSELVAPLIERATDIEYEDWVSQGVGQRLPDQHAAARAGRGDQGAAQASIPAFDAIAVSLSLQSAPWHAPSRPKGSIHRTRTPRCA